MFHKSLGILFPVSLLALAAQASIITETIGKRATVKSEFIYEEYVFCADENFR